MFEIGRDYKFSIGFGDEIDTWVGEVLGIDPPLIKVSRLEEYMILNTSAASFVSAEALPYRSREAKPDSRTIWEGPLRERKKPGPETDA